MRWSRLLPGSLAAVVVTLILGCVRSASEKAAPPVEPAPAPGQPVTAAPASAQPRDTTGDKLLVTEAEYQGWKYYAVYCERCHGPDALGNPDAADLRYSVSSEGQVTPDSFRVVVLKGTKNEEENKVMKGFEGVLDDQRITQIYAYLQARSEGRLAAGRPHRAPPQ